VSPIEILLGVAFPLLVGVGLALAMGSGSSTEFWIARIALIVAALDLSGLIVWWLYNVGLSWWKITIGVAVAAGLLLALPEILRWIDRKQADVIATARQPDVTLRFVYPKSPNLQLMNTSTKTAREIKFAAAVWNIDLPERRDPLPIPISTFDFLRAGQIGGPQAVFTSPLVAPLVNTGNRLLGSASVSCPDCNRGRTFVVSIVWGADGWYAELPEEKSGDLIVPRHFTKEELTAYFNEFPNTIAPISRIPIGEP
jgi:hypothetical protein